MIEDKVIFERSTIKGLADAIRLKRGITNELLGSQFEAEVLSIPTAENLDEERAEHDSIVAELEAEIEGLDDRDKSKLQFVIGAQDANSPYTITQEDVGDIAEIPQYFFYQKTGLVGVDIESATVLGQYAFYDCANLVDVNLPNVKNVGAYCFQKCIKRKHFNFSKATIIGQRAFSNCTELETLDISSATSIGSYMCNSCTYLTEVKMEKVKTIDSYAFQHCYRLGYIEIPATCTSIANNAFSNVGRATDSGKAIYRFLGDTPPSIYANTFNRDYVEKIIVNKGCGETYRTTTNLVNFADLIEEATE